MGEGTVFSGVTISGPPDAPDGTPEGTVFSGATIGEESGGGSSGAGSFTGTGTVIGPVNASPLPVTDTTTLLLTTALPNGAGVGQTYTQINVAFGGVPPYSFFIVGGALPEGTALNTSNGLPGNSGLVLGVPTVAGPFNYTVEVQDSSGIVSVESIGGGSYTDRPNSLVGPNIATSNADELVMIVCITSHEDTTANPRAVETIVVDGLTFTRILHDESFTYTDSTGDADFPVAAFSVDIFTAPAPTVVSGLSWDSTTSGPAANHGDVFVFVIGGLKDINNPFDPNVSLPNIASNLTGTSSAPANTISTTEVLTTLFGLAINHGPSGDAAPAPAPGWATVAGPTDNGGGASGFGAIFSSFNETSAKTSTTFTAGYSDDFWLSILFAFVGGGGTPTTVTEVVSGTIAQIAPGSETFTTNPETQPAYFIVPNYNTLTVELWGGSETGSEVISTFGLILTAAANEFATFTFNSTTAGAPPEGGQAPMVYTVGAGSPSGQITFTWA